MCLQIVIRDFAPFYAGFQDAGAVMSLTAIVLNILLIAMWQTALQQFGQGFSIAAGPITTDI